MDERRVLAGCALTVWIGLWIILPSSTLWVPTYVLGVNKGVIVTVAIWLALSNWPPLRKSTAFVAFLQRMTDWWRQHALVNGPGLLRPESARPALFAHHPHGIVAINCLAVGAASNCRPGVSHICFMMPFNRQLMQLVGGLAATRKDLGAEMGTGVDLAIIPGGIDEVVLCDPSVERVFLKSRFGFVKLALEHGYDIVPVYHLGESQSYQQIPWLNRWPPLTRARLAFTKITSFPAVLPFFGWYGTFLPWRCDCVSVIGDPVSCPRIPNPTRAEIAEYHGRYVAALVKTFDSAKHRLPAYRDRTLEVW